MYHIFGEQFSHGHSAEIIIHYKKIRPKFALVLKVLIAKILKKKSKILRGLELIKKQSGYAKKNSGLLPTVLCLAEASKNRII